MSRFRRMFLSAIVTLGVSSDIATEPPMHRAAEMTQQKTEAPIADAKSLEVLADTSIDSTVNDSVAETKLSEVLERVPDAIQQRINKAGGKVVLFEGRIRGIDQIEKLEEKTNTHLYCSTMDIEQADGVYVKELNTAYVRNDPFRPKLALHEYAHMADRTLGNISQEPGFRRIYLRAKTENPEAFKKNADREYAALTAKEFFAECFAEYYLDPISREELKKDFPQAHDHISKLEKEVREKTWKSPGQMNGQKAYCLHDSGADFKKRIKKEH